MPVSARLARDFKEEAAARPPLLVSSCLGAPPWERMAGRHKEAGARIGFVAEPVFGADVVALDTAVRRALDREDIFSGLVKTPSRLL